MDKEKMNKENGAVFVGGFGNLRSHNYFTFVPNELPSPALAHPKLGTSKVSAYYSNYTVSPFQCTLYIPTYPFSPLFYFVLEFTRHFTYWKVHEYICS